jgi:hypothetical protein
MNSDSVSIPKARIQQIIAKLEDAKETLRGGKA